MGEGFLRKACMEGRLANVLSAGSHPNGTIHPLAVKVMAEAGVDLSRHHSKSMHALLKRSVHVVITVCGNADQVCPDYPGQIKKYHWAFDDPSHTTGTEEEILADFRRVRDLIRNRMFAYAKEIFEGKDIRSFKV